MEKTRPTMPTMDNKWIGNKFQKSANVHVKLTYVNKNHNRKSEFLCKYRFFLTPLSN